MDETQVSQALAKLIEGAPEFWAQVVAEYQTQQTVVCIGFVLIVFIVAVFARIGFTVARRAEDELNRAFGMALSAVVGGLLALMMFGFAVDAFARVVSPNASLLMKMR